MEVSMSLLGAFIVPHPPIIIPEIGKGQEKKVSATVNSYREAARRIAALRPDTIIRFVVFKPTGTLQSQLLKKPLTMSVRAF
jgi:aromatic ring-opening dioxygenase LigB subunit